eukprot:924081-Alexandrium_andersonii.AAC.1
MPLRAPRTRRARRSWPRRARRRRRSQRASSAVPRALRGAPAPRPGFLPEDAGLRQPDAALQVVGPGR